MVALPGEVHELAVDREPEKLGVAVVELLVEPAEGRDLRRADEGEVLRPGEEHEPLAREAFVGGVDEGVVRIARQRAARHGLEGKGRELLANTEHDAVSLGSLRPYCLRNHLISIAIYIDKNKIPDDSECV